MIWAMPVAENRNQCLNVDQHRPQQMGLKFLEILTPAWEETLDTFRHSHLKG